MPLGPQRTAILLGASKSSATGGTESTATVGGQAYKFHTFTSSGTFQEVVVFFGIVPQTTLLVTRPLS